MDIEERQQQIARLVQSKKRVKALALSRMFDVSVETIRKDLLDLQEQGVLVRVHGGAQIRPVEQESAYERRRAVKAAAKEAIAKQVVDTIQDGATVYIDYGTTTYALAAELLHSRRRARVITNSMPIANLLGESDLIETILLGGILRRNERSLFGPLAEKALDSIYMDIGFFGCAGVHPVAGVTNHHAFEAATSFKAMTHCSTVALLADSQKLETIAVNKLADLSDIDVLVTDDHPSPELSAALELADVTVTLVKE
ncbi:MAG TPA: DeoR/GlpR family DNA-binding transcription regulator [Arachnia sp.]|nr:DeoR/GlpR family DNA-binding transcription regulator [Arachnia sp.]HMT85766.1 DeoR/GlpR family DNA-binding transcription regulator [Arachnia sp.]